MPHGTDRARPAYAGENDALIFALLADAVGEPSGEIQLAQARPEPIAVPRPQAWDTITIAVITGRPLKLDFDVNDVKTREVVRDDLVLGFEDGGKIVLKDYMHAFGMLGEHRTTIIQPDGKHYAFTELLAPTAGPRAETPGTRGDVVIVQKPPAGETQTFKLNPDKPMALNFGMGDVARSEVKDGNLVLTFKHKGILVLEGYATFKDSADIAIYFAKGDKISLGDLAPGAGPGDPGGEGGHLFTEFAPGGTLGSLAHLGPLGPAPFDLVPPPGPPESPPPATPPPPEFPPPPPPPVLCKPPPQDCEPPPVCEPKIVICDPDPEACAPDPKDGGKDHGKLTWVVASGCEIGGDAHWPGGRWGEDGGKHDRGGQDRLHADAGHRGWTNGHDDGGAQHAHTLRPSQAEHDGQGAWTHDDAGTHGALHDHGWHRTALHDNQGPDAGGSAPDGPWSHQSAHHDQGHDGRGGQDGHLAPVSSHDVFDTGAAPAPAGGHGHHAAAHDIGAVMAHAENHAPQIENHAQHNVMGHG
jgi:hypothetical protein